MKDEMLKKRAVDFLERYGCERLLGIGFGNISFDGLLSKTGYKDNSDGFFEELKEKLLKRKTGESDAISIGNVNIPHLFLMEILDEIMSGEELITIHDVSQLESVTNVVVRDKEKMQEVLDTYPVRFSKHIVRQMRLSKDVAFQYMPSVDELDPEGLTNTWVGQFHKGLLERMYQNRPIFVLNMACPVYCRFCFRKHKECRNQSAPTIKDVEDAVGYIAAHPEIKEVVLTGGDVFMNKATLMAAIDRLKGIPHIQTLRIATRNIAYYPDMFYKDDGFWMEYLKTEGRKLRDLGKRIEIATHFIHHDEISIKSLDLISDFVRGGIAVYVQTPFLKDCNEDPSVLIRLYGLLRSAGAEVHYIYIPCSAIQGNKAYWTPLSKGVETAKGLRDGLTDRAMPRICVATPIGKVDMNTSGWAVEQDGKRIWMRTSFTADYLKAFAEDFDMTDCRVNEEGTLDYRHLVPEGIGDKRLLFGKRKKTAKITTSADKVTLDRLRDACLFDQRDNFSISKTDISGLSRKHKTRVELDVGCEDLYDAMAYLREDRDITDVILSAKDGVVSVLDKVCSIVQMLRPIDHIVAIRLRELNLNYDPAIFTEDVIAVISGLQDLSIVRPLRMEVETQFLHETEFLDAHSRLADCFRRKGITVYANSQLLSGVNNGAEDMQKISYRCREKDIEFHHLYVCGMSLQDKWNEDKKIIADSVLDIATYLRRYGSGREIPRIIIRSQLGESDFNLTSRFIRTYEGIMLEGESLLFTKLAFDGDFLCGDL